MSSEHLIPSDVESQSEEQSSSSEEYVDFYGYKLLVKSQRQKLEKQKAKYLGENISFSKSFVCEDAQRAFSKWANYYA
ncbi:hypothetical protein TVAG_329060 [Trichomonas vaginalis G3]|uniref:Uncharacterized protein n=1 Tax=Trichomonas vaginalis (strain ATCC PRA-98 / G3) TaxID=412133 RepID=A2EW47_TRIV3|nr:hypothetical protein TVAGG3_0686810 [Trichomonas vaginalis G3]EAY03133.1 hypothetical protein TVAG_329060 [Trichomonas vaginalis G3]KAI5508279.1 hypothetical protein TVAGG3_0686810 [Trichomonas vaginalis G3]|eukprot:XP_001315356.1 hypothetical protein [Trichomonas vaginalis G3]